jgi:hypothetical protein
MDAVQLAQYVLLATVIAGVTELLNRLRGKDFWAATTIATSAIIGGVFGAFGIEGLTLVSGIAAGFGVSGGISALRGKSQTTPRSVIDPTVPPPPPQPLIVQPAARAAAEPTPPPARPVRRQIMVQ